MRANLTFFCELGSSDLSCLFQGSDLIQTLRSMQAGVCLGIIDLSNERAEVVKKLNAARIPVHAWLLLPESEGYWFNLGNSDCARKRYVHFVEWTRDQELKWERVGIDIEPDINFMNKLLTNKPRGLFMILRRLILKDETSRAETEYARLIEQMQADGYEVESYQIPFVLDEKKVHTHLLKKVFGIVSLPVNEEIPMLYSSMFKSKKPGLLLSYAEEVSSLAIGSTGGGVVMDGVGELTSLTDLEYRRDLRIATERCRHVYIFSLEGCVRRGLLDPGVRYEDGASRKEVRAEKARWDGLRIWLRICLWMIMNSWLLLLVLIALISLLFFA